MQFVKVVRPLKVGRCSTSSSLSGTQALDSTWRTLDATIPPQVHSKLNHDANPLLEKYTYVWLYRVNHRNEDGFQRLGKYICKNANV